MHSCRNPGKFVRQVRELSEDKSDTPSPSPPVDSAAWGSQMVKGQPHLQLNGAIIVSPGLNVSPLVTRTSGPTEPLARKAKKNEINLPVNH